MVGWIKVILIGLVGAGSVWLLVTGLPIEDVREASRTDWDNWESQTAADFDQEVLTAQTRFAFEFLSELLRLQPAQNVFVSPTSVTFALSMTLNGAATETHRAMADALGIRGSRTVESIVPTPRFKHPWQRGIGRSDLWLRTRSGRARDTASRTTS